MKDLVSCDETTVEALKTRLKQAKTIAEFQRIQCVLMRATLKCTAGSSAAKSAARSVQSAASE